TDRELRTMLDDLGLAVADLDCIAPIAGRGDDGEAFYGATEDDVLRAAAGLGARSVNVVLRHDEHWTIDAAAAEFARVCDRAVADGLLVHIEPVPFMKVKSVPAGWEIVRLADRPNGGIQIDAWHHFRGPARDDDLSSVPGERILAVQLCDAPAEPDGKAFEEANHRRRVPGEGDLDLTGLLRLLYRDRGCRAPIGVEIFSDEVDARPPAEVGRIVADATKRVVATALKVQRKGEG
ncbi:MAG TPA: TIM barrel protein, partial [Acidimicrobiales bacterium]|nr:TIM barrel protein [Acidimicrobiales bacterium]